MGAWAYLVVAAIAIPLFALVFSVVTLFLALFWSRFKPVGDFSFGRFYLQFLIIAAAYVGLSFLGIGGLLGLAVMGLTYKLVFGAGWVEALVIGIVGGLVAWGLLIGILAALARLGMAS